MSFRVATTITGPFGSPGYNRLHFDSLSFPGQTGAEAAATAAVNWWAAVSVRISNTLTFQVEPEVLEVDSTGSTVAAYVVPTRPEVKGTETADPLPWSTQGLVRLRTGVYVAGREVRGRIFIPGMTELGNTGGRPTASARTIIDAAAAVLADNDPALQVLGAAGPQVVAGASMWNEWAYLSSRRD